MDKQLEIQDPVQIIPDPGPGQHRPGTHYDSVSQTNCGRCLSSLEKTPRKWLVGAFIAFCFVNLLLYCVWTLFVQAASASGASIFRSAWGFAIINFVWWIGIGHAGTLISAVLFLLKQDWRTAINRFSEAMTLFAVACAGMFPILHLGRPWLGYWLIPYPNSMWLWPQPRSPLEWDVFAVSTYATVSLVFWYVGLIPDLATMRDTAPEPWMRRVYGSAVARMARFGHSLAPLSKDLISSWRGIATPLVLSVHTIVSFDFAVSCSARLAHHHIPALLRRGRHLLRFCHGADAYHSAARLVQHARLVDAAAH